MTIRIEKGKAVIGVDEIGGKVVIRFWLLDHALPTGTDARNDPRTLRPADIEIDCPDIATCELFRKSADHARRLLQTVS